MNTLPGWAYGDPVGARSGRDGAGFTLSLARQTLHGDLDTVVTTAEDNIRLLRP